MRKKSSNIAGRIVAYLRISQLGRTWDTIMVLVLNAALGFMLFGFAGHWFIKYHRWDDVMRDFEEALGFLPVIIAALMIAKSIFCNGFVLACISA